MSTVASLAQAPENEGDPIVTVDRFVPHISTVPANLGQTVGLFLRERVLASTQQAPLPRRPQVVLFIHGGYSPSVVAYDFGYKDYSFMAALARAGFDAFAMRFAFHAVRAGPSRPPSRCAGMAAKWND